MTQELFLENEPLNRLNDVAFKYIMGSPGSERALEDFLDSVREGDGAAPLGPLKFVDREMPSGRVDGKSVRLDILAEAECGAGDQGTQCHVEVQLYHDADAARRFAFYWARSIGHALGRGSGYAGIPNSILVILFGNRADRGLFPPGERHFHGKIVDLYTGGVLTDILEIHGLFIDDYKEAVTDMQGARKQTGRGDSKRLRDWMAWFTNAMPLERAEELSKENSGFRAAVEKERLFVMDKVNWEAYLHAELEADAIRGLRKCSFEAGEEEGLEKGRAEGLEKGRADIVRRLAGKGHSAESIAEATEIPLHEIQRILESEGQQAES